MTLLALYVGALAFGGILVGASVFGAGKDADGDGSPDAGPDQGDADHGDVGHADADHGDLAHDHGDLGHAHDHDHALHADARSLGNAAAEASSGVSGLLVANLLSLRFWTFGLAAFGLTGLLLTLFGVTGLLGLAVASPTGLGVGWAAATVIRSLARETRSTELRTTTLQGREAEVVLAIAPDKLGKIKLSHAGQTIELMATTPEQHRLERGDRVLVVEVKDGRATVTSLMPNRTGVLTPQGHRIT
jgi:membrane protein implicated in regulation of membrane protease activity